jgi:hypothetical protein
MIKQSVIKSALILCFMTLCLPVSYSMGHKVNVNQAIDNAIRRYGLQTEPELQRWFKAANVAYPPREISLLAFKKERKLELWARGEDNKHWRFIHTYPLTAMSGRLGPKLKERDGQIPEGLYRLTSFNPFSSMHLSMMINYPNNYDRLQASKEGRRQLGNNIFLHGKTFSVGCLAVGDRNIDQLFLLARRVGLGRIQVVIAPNDLRKGKPATSSFAQPRWLPDLYQQIATALNHYPIKNYQG